jgi:hypothetical protein
MTPDLRQLARLISVQYEQIEGQYSLKLGFMELSRHNTYLVVIERWRPEKRKHEMGICCCLLLRLDKENIKNVCCA